MIFSTHRRIEARRRFGTREFQAKVKHASGYKRLFNPSRSRFFSRFFSLLRFKKISWRIFGVLLLLLVSYFLVVSKYFLVTNITLAGNKKVVLSEVSDAINTASNNRLFLIPKNHYFLMSRGRVNQIITAAIPDVKQVTKINRHWPNGIDIEINERNAGFVFIVRGKPYIVDEEGTVMTQAESADLPQVVDGLDDDIVVGETLPNPKTTTFILSMYKNWGTKINSEVSGIKIPGKASTEVQFISLEGWSAFFDVTRPMQAQLGSLALILNKQIQPKDKGRLAYIDLRSDKWVYYCFKATPCSSEPVGTDGINASLPQ